MGNKNFNISDDLNFMAKVCTTVFTALLNFDANVCYKLAWNPHPHKNLENVEAADA